MSENTATFSPIIQLDNLSTLPYQKLHNLDNYINTTKLQQPELQHNLSNEILLVNREALFRLAQKAMHDIAHFFRPSHLQYLNNILDDTDASHNDKIIAYELLKNAVIASSETLPSCQDTGTAIVHGSKGQYFLTNSHHYDSDEEALSLGIAHTYTNNNLRYSQLAPISMYEEKNTLNNLPAQIDISINNDNEYKLLFIAKGGGSANKTFFFPKTPALLNKDNLQQFIKEQLLLIGTTACPPYYLSIVVGGLSAEHNTKILKLATCRYLDNLPTSGSTSGRAFRDLQMEQDILLSTQHLNVGASFGGKYFCHGVRVIRLPRHAASLPIGIGVSCAADRQVNARINKNGVFLEQLEYNPTKYLPKVAPQPKQQPPSINLDQPMHLIQQNLSLYPIGTRLLLNGTIIMARDMVHQAVCQKPENPDNIPPYFKNHPIFYGGPAKTPQLDNYVVGSLGPTTSARMDIYLEYLQKFNASLITIGKGNRSENARLSCATHGGFYLATIGGIGASLSQQHIKKYSIIDFQHFHMEAVAKLYVENFPVFIVIDNNGNDLYKSFLHNQPINTNS